MFTFFSRSRVYDAADIVLALDLGRQSAVAIDNSRRYTAAVAESRAFQQTGIGVISHELRNLLAPIRGWTTLLKKHSAVERNPILLEGVESLDRNTRHMTRLIDDCLDLTCVTTGRLRMECSRVDLNTVMLAAVDGVREAAWEKRHSLLVELSSTPLWIHGDAARLQQVASNILTNAVKYSDPGGRLYVRSIGTAAEAEVEVADTGRGIEAQELRRIFDPFYSGTASQSSGLGIGLAISRHIVTLHKGSIWVESPGPGEGCQVHFRLPLAEVSPDKDLDPVAPMPKSKARRVLLVEDSPDVRDLMKLQLEVLGHTVFLVSDARDAVGYASLHNPDVIVSDIKMSGLDGYGLARLLRSEPATAAIPLLAVTGLSMTGDAEEIVRAGFDGCLLKPVEDEELDHWIERLTLRND
jgi:CheY-like chemotaxis protein